MTTPSPSLVELAAQIQKHAASLQEGLKKGGYLQPTFGTDSIQIYPSALQDGEIYQARMALMGASQAMLEYAL